MTLLLIAVCISVGIFILGALYGTFLRTKAWLCDKKRPNLNDPDVNVIVKINRVFWEPEVVDWTFDMFTICVLLFVAMGILVLCYYFTPIFWLIGMTVLTTAGLHSLRWAIRLKKSLSKLKLSSHEHD